MFGYQTCPREIIECFTLEADEIKTIELPFWPCRNRISKFGMAHIISKSGYMCIKRLFAKLHTLGECLSKCPCGVGLFIATYLPYLDYAIEIISLPLAICVYFITFFKCWRCWRFGSVTRYLCLPTPILQSALAVDVYTKECEEEGTCTLRGDSLEKQVLTDTYLYDPAATIKLKLCMTIVPTSLCELLKVLMALPVACIFDTFMIQGEGRQTDVKLEIIFPMPACCGSSMASTSCEEYGEKVLYERLLVSTKENRSARFQELCEAMSQERKDELDIFSKQTSLTQMIEGAQEYIQEKAIGKVTDKFAEFHGDAALDQANERAKATAAAGNKLASQAATALQIGRPMKQVTASATE